MDEHLVADVCERVGLYPRAFRQLYPTDDALLDAIHADLVEECVQRLRGGVERFVPSASKSRFDDAARTLAGARPVDRSGMIIRTERRVRALAGKGDAQMVVRSERQFVGMLVDVLTELMDKLGRTFAWMPVLAVRVILDTYERSFEAWLLDGNSESQFEESPYIKRTLPTLLRQLTRPAGTPANWSGRSSTQPQRVG